MKQRWPESFFLTPLVFQNVSLDLESSHIWQSDSCSYSGYHRSNQNLPMFLLDKWQRKPLLLPKLKSNSGSVFSQIFDSGSERKTQNPAGLTPDPWPPLLQSRNKSGEGSSVASLAVFLQIWACFFCGVLDFWRLTSCLFFADCFFQILWQFCHFNLSLNIIWVCFCVDFLILGLFFQICLHAFVFIYLLFFCFVYFSYQTHFRLVFRLNYSLWACF